MGWLLDRRLLRAVRAGAAGRVRELIARGAKVECRALDGLTPLMTAANYGHIQVMETLIQAGAEVDATSKVGGTGGGSWSGFTALHAATADSTGAVGPVELLIRRGADPRARDSRGRTARDYAEISGYTEIRVFLEGGPAEEG